MVLLNSYIPLLLWTLTSAQWLKPRTTEEGNSHTLQQLSILPNPYPMPDSPYSIHFHDPGPFLGPGPEVLRFMDYALTRIIIQIEDQGGDRYLPHLAGDEYGYSIENGPYLFGVRTVRFGLTFNDTTQILAAYTLKMRMEGYRERTSYIFDTATRDIIGTALLERFGSETGPRNKTLQLGPIPNPFVLSHSDLSLDFQEPMSHLIPNDVVSCIVNARRRVTRRISEHGEGPITIPTIWFTWRSVEFRILAQQVARRVTLNDTLSVLDAFAIKTGHEGFQSRWANIITNPGGQMVGQAILGHAHLLAGEAGNRTTSLESYRRARRRIST